MSDKKEMTPEDVKNANQALKELREIVESKNADSAEAKAKIEKLESSLDSFEEKNQKLVGELAEQRKLQEQLKEQYDELETKLARGSRGGSDEEATMEMKSFEKFISKGPQNLSADEAKYLRTDSNVDGGYLAPTEYVAEIIKNITEVSPVRQVARVRRTSRGEIEIPKRTAKGSGGWRGEGGDLASGNSQYGMIKIPAHHLDIIVPITNTMLTDAAFNMETEINQDVIEDFNALEGAAFVNGTGVTQPEGFMQNADVSVRNSGIANNIDPDNFFDLQGDLKVGYMGQFGFNKRTLAAIRKMKGGDGHYLFAPAASGAPATVAGESYVIMQDMPDIGAGNEPVAYGDWMKAYVVLDSTQLTIIRDPYTLAGSGKTRFIFSKRTGGKVQLPEALKKLKCSA